VVTRLLLALPAALLFASAAGGHEYAVGHLSIGHPWARATAPGMPMGVVYLTLTNRGTKEDALVAAQTPAAARVEIHQTLLADGMARMRPLTQIVIGAGKVVKVGPGGIHLMLVDLARPLVAGSSVPLTLTFRVAGKIEVQAKVEADPQ
jgi:periplasmic copper chaperone A